MREIKNEPKIRKTPSKITAESEPEKQHGKRKILKKDHLFTELEEEKPHGLRMVKEYRAPSVDKVLDSSADFPIEKFRPHVKKVVNKYF